MDWEDEYKRKFVSPEEAAGKVKSGDWVIFPTGRAPRVFGFALAARKEELRGVHIREYPSYNFGWYDPGWEESFIVHAAPTAVTQRMFDERKADLGVGGMDVWRETDDPGELDVVGVEISTPDKHGFCSFGSSLWNKKRLVRKAKIAIGEVNPKLIRTYGDNFIHFSEFDCLVEHASSGGEPGRVRSLAGREIKEPEPYMKTIAGHVRELIRDGDTLQMGVSRTVESLLRLGMIEGKHDLGWHSEATIPGVIRGVREGVINGKRKTLNPGICVTTAIGGDTREEMEWVAENPLFRVVESSYIWDIRVCAAHDQFVAINAAAMIDLCGQITAERVGYRIIGGGTTQVIFVMAAWISEGGRVIHVMPSTVQTKEGLRSRIVVDFPKGTWITQHRAAAQFIVTEYGIADIGYKSVRQRVQALIAVAHPDFRDELWQEAQSLYWP